MSGAARRPKLTVATTFAVHPARGGGQRRVRGLYGAVAALGVDVEVVTLAPAQDRARALALAPGLTELRVPRSPAHAAAEQELEREAGLPVGDFGLLLFGGLTPAYADAVRASACDAAGVVACHPYPAPTLAAAAPGRPLLYEAQDVEADLKATLLGTDSRLVAAVREAEGACCAQAALTFTCSAADQRRLAELYGLEPARACVVPNGTDCDAAPFTGVRDRRALRAGLGLAGTRVGLFVGSWHGPNLEAARTVVAAAGTRPDWRLLLLGGAGAAVVGAAGPPANVDVCGIVDDAFVTSVLRFSDAALNPMASGSGSNLKMLDYAAAGAPLVSTRFGARGLDMEPGVHYLEAEAGPEGLGAALDALAAEAPERTAARVAAAADHVRRRFDWSVIAQAWLRHRAMQDILWA